MIRTLTSVLFLGILLAGCTGTRPANLGVRDGRLSSCPASPNCVSSQDSDKDHAVEPLRYDGSPQQAMERLKQIVGGMKRARIITDTATYVHAEFTSAIFRFVDNVEFLLDESSGTIQVRSASRIGSSDLGVNRKRIEAIRAQWTRPLRSAATAL